MQPLYKWMLVITGVLLLNVTILRAQNVGIGTNQPDTSAALDISSNNKGLLIPRVSLISNPIQFPATGLMVFNPNNRFRDGMGIYINMGVPELPLWRQLVSESSGLFIRNQTTQQPGSNFSITGNGAIAGNLDAGSVSMRPENTGTSTVFGAWKLRHLGPNSAASGSFTISIIPNTPAISILRNGFVGINRVDMPTEALQVNGNIKASGNVLIDVEYVRRDATIGSHSRRSFTWNARRAKRLLAAVAVTVILIRRCMIYRYIIQAPIPVQEVTVGAFLYITPVAIAGLCCCIAYALRFNRRPARVKAREGQRPINGSF
ncbi:hypothetical protein [Paraflavitalea speifideaquila]|uniref:hypothetical protein n=1 Tax=Paraflavitalea speifideaquila TaxID=3076558 RepID=UPI0028E27E0A|nr:hypothetical protein [Paraflavitalea speifideiaquila]